MLDALAAMLRERTDDRVYVAHMEMAEPTLAQAFETAYQEGVRSVVVFPYFLSPGRHSREDIPRLCAEAAGSLDELSWHCAAPIGLDPIMAELIIHRIQRCRDEGYECNSCPDQAVCYPHVEIPPEK